MDSNRTEVREIENKISKMNSKIDDFQRKVETLPTKLNADFKGMVTDLKEKRSELENKVDRLKDAGDGAYQDIQAGAKMALDDLNTAYESALERFNKKDKDQEK
ncbi:MAG: hypothetical protein QF441_11035 [Bacteriovoracaceae bacterium]|jgi:chromosome segregation ATPase|nr:hypothetical protein [Halobacteriovoraceae bacterium]MDP7321136.1 hypothetical protein [Bacteriovoracaceae bacterium]|tara:strand:+ start:472 stop:783 length:312 start_codon:yes stop_codon:yes gene_type:complete